MSYRAVNNVGAKHSQTYPRSEQRRAANASPLLPFLAATILLAFALRMVRLDFQPLWWDEGYTVFFATRDLATMLARTSVDIHPPLYYALLQLWIPFAAKSDVALRLFSVGVGVAAIPLTYLVGRELLDRRAAALAALLLAISPLHVYYSQEVRMYGLVTLLGLASIGLQLFLLKPVQRFDNSVNPRNPVLPSVGTPPPARFHFAGETQRRLAWLAYILVTTAALYAQYYAAFIVAAEIAVVLFWRIRQNKYSPAEPASNPGNVAATPPLRSVPTALARPNPLRRGLSIGMWASAWFLIFVLYLPWLMYAEPRLYNYVTAKVDLEQYSRLDPVSFLAQHLEAFSVGHLGGFTWLAWGALLFVALAVWGALDTLRHPNQTADRGPATARPGKGESAIALNQDEAIASPIILVYLLVPLICGWLVNLIYSFHPIRYERLLLFVAPTFYLLVALGLISLLRRQPRWAIAGFAAISLICGLSLYDFYTVPRYAEEDYRLLIREMEALAQPGDVVLAPYPWQIGYLESYYHGPPLQTVEVPSAEWISQPVEMGSALNSIRASSPRVWLLAYQTKGRVLEDRIANFFAQDYRLADDWFVNTRLEYFARGSDPPLNEAPLEFAPDLQLVSFGVGSEPITAGAGFIRLRLHWQARSNAYSYSLRLVDTAGQLKMQEDAPISSGNDIERRGWFLPRDLAGGEYEVRLVVYRRADESSLALPDGKRQVSLGRIRVSAP